MAVGTELGADEVDAAAPRPERSTELSLLRGFELRSEGTPIALPLAAQKLVAFVALHAGPVPRGFVAGSLWPSVDEERAHGSLRSALWRLRTAGRNVIDGALDMLALAADLSVDVRRGRDLAQAILDGSGLPADRPAASACARPSDVELLSKDLLPGWYDDWVLLEAERWRYVRLHALEALAPRLAAAGRFCDALMVALEAVRADPLRESAHAALIGVHLAEGNVSEALRQYERFAEILRAELGIQPSYRLRGLVSGEGSVTLP